jgi:peroxiredoxin
VANRLDEFRATGITVVAISMSRPDVLARYVAERPLPVPIFADPDRTVYAALELGRTSWVRLLRPRMVARYLGMIARGGKVGRVPEGEDALQLGGDFLVDRQGRIVWAYRSVDPTDRPSVEQLLALRSGPSH